jgi:hypothetical protein
MKRNCWDNAVGELFKTLKTEQIYGNKLISSKNRWNEIYLNLLKFTIEKKAFSSRLQNN